MTVESVTHEPHLHGYSVKIDGKKYFTRDFVQEGDTVEMEVLDENEVKLTTSETVDDISFIL